MKNRNLEQNDLMFNVQIEFGVHGVNNWKTFISKLQEYLNVAGDTIRIVGVQTKKPTARVDILNAIDLTQLAINAYDLNAAKWANLSDMAKFWAMISQMNNTMSRAITEATNSDKVVKEKEDGSDDKESN